jgi:hypothetical protein
MAMFAALTDRDSRKIWRFNSASCELSTLQLLALFPMCEGFCAKSAGRSGERLRVAHPPRNNAIESIARPARRGPNLLFIVLVATYFIIVRPLL